MNAGIGGSLCVAAMSRDFSCLLLTVKMSYKNKPTPQCLCAREFVLCV